MTIDKEKLQAFYQRINILGKSYNPINKVRFSEVPTYMRAPQTTDLSQVDIGILGIPNE